jgi:hypothetical protein
VPTLPKAQARAYAKLYAKRGWRFIPLRPESKMPARKGWTEREFSIDELPTDANVGVILGAVSGDLVDIDLDSEAAVALAPYFLPETLTFGHESKPASHWLYTAKGVRADKLWFGDPEDNSDRELIELRANNASGPGCGHQTAFPGSVWSSKDGKRKEAVEFDNDLEPTEISASELIWTVAKLATASAIAKTWHSGRHEKSLAITGGLLKAGWTTEEVRDCMAAVREACGDTPDEEADFGHDVESTIEKAELEGVDGLSGFGSLVQSGVLKDYEATALERHSRSPATRKREATLASTRMGKPLLDEMIKHAREVDGLEAVGDIVAKGPKAVASSEAVADKDGGDLDYGAWILKDLTTDPVPINYVVEALALGPGKISTVNGSPGTAKGLIMSYVALCVAAGVECFGHPVRRCRVFYGDAETGQLAETRIKRMARALGLDLAALQDEGWITFAEIIPPVTKPWLEFLESQLIENGIGFMVGDSYTSMVGGDQNKSEWSDIAFELGRMSNRLDVCFLVSTHAKKKQAGGKMPAVEMTSGHGTIMAAQQTSIYVVRPDEKVATELDYACTRADGPGFAPFRVRWVDVEDPDPPKESKYKGMRPGKKPALDPSKWGLRPELIPITEATGQNSDKEILDAANAADLKARIVRFLKKTSGVGMTTIRSCVEGSNTAIRDALAELVEDPGSHVELMIIGSKAEYRWTGK